MVPVLYFSRMEEMDMTITVMSPGHNGLLNHRRRYYLFDSLFENKKTPKLRMISPLYYKKSLHVLASAVAQWKQHTEVWYKGKA